MLSLLKKT